MRSFLISVMFLVSYSAAAIVVTPSEWDFSTIESDSAPISQVVQILNNSDREITVTLISTCGCLSAAPAMLKLPAGESGDVTLVFDPVDEKGRVEKDMIILTNQPGFTKSLFLVHGEVPAVQKSPRLLLLPAGLFSFNIFIPLAARAACVF